MGIGNRPAVDWFGDVDVDRTKGRLPEQPHSIGILQTGERERVLHPERITRIEEHVAAHSQRFDYGESDLLAEQQLLAAAHLLDSEGLPELVEQGLLRTQRIDLVAAHLALAIEAAGKKALVQRQIAAGAFSRPPVQVPNGP